MNDALELTGVHKSFDGNPALADARFALAWGEVHALLGENGAGKSTLMNVACGLYAPDHGTVKVDGQGVSITGPLAARALGIGMVHQHFKLVRSLTVAENILLGHRAKGFRRGLADVREAAGRIAEEIGFEVDPDARIDQLSVSEQQRVEIVKALTGGTRILILDEPTAVLTDEEAERLFVRLKLLAKQDRAVVVITHKLREVFAHTDRVTVMRAGRTVEEGRAPDTIKADELSRLMVGDAREYDPAERLDPGPVRLALEGVSARRDNGVLALDGLSLALRGATVYGLAGVGGNGQSELAEILMGLRMPEAGRILLEGAPLRPGSPRRARSGGIACIPSDRYVYGLAGELSVMENYIVSHLDDLRYGSAGWLRWGAVLRDAARAIESFNILGAKPSTRARLLSGGNAQKLVLAREMSGEANVLLAHSPTRGLDVRACAAVHQALREACRKGTAVLLISEDLDEILAISDRIGVINRGRIVGEFDWPADRQAIGRLMAGHA